MLICSFLIYLSGFSEPIICTIPVNVKNETIISTPPKCNTSGCLHPPAGETHPSSSLKPLIIFIVFLFRESPSPNLPQNAGAPSSEDEIPGGTPKGPEEEGEADSQPEEMLTD